jgi:hypothetical protein
MALPRLQFLSPHERVVEFDGNSPPDAVRVFTWFWGEEGWMRFDLASESALPVHDVDTWVAVWHIGEQLFS